MAATTLVLITAAGLVTLTTSVRHAGANVAAAFESVRLAEGAEIDLLLLSRADDPIVRHAMESDLRQKLSDAHGFVTSRAEADRLDGVTSRLDGYLDSAGAESVTPAELGAMLDASYRDLDAFVDVNTEQARAAEVEAERWDEMAKAVGLGLGALLVLGSGALVWWLEVEAFGPIMELAGAMERFGRGDRGARANESGPDEVRNIGRRFNEIAAALASQRDTQLAFLAGVAHDLRNPLSVLRMSVRMIRPDVPLPPEPRVRRTFELIDRQIAHLDRMVGDFLDMAQIEAGALELRVEARDLREIVSDVAHLFESTSPPHPIELALPDHPIAVRCDPLRIEQVVTNLVSNATKYSPSGGSVEIAVHGEADWAELVVRDHGIGISEADQRSVFEPFRRAEASRDAIPGAGLGLHVVRRIVEAHAGRIEIESALGEGSTFRVRLPLGGPARA